MLICPPLILSLALTLTTVIAGSSLGKPTCYSCTVRVRDCEKVRTAVRR
jgi:hypothetical protein